MWGKRNKKKNVMDELIKMNGQTPITHSIIFRQKHTNTTIPIKGQDRETDRIIANAQQQNPYSTKWEDT